MVAFSYFSGEGAFHAMMASFGWAKFPMIHRISALDPGVPMTFIYGARSWIDRHPGQQIQQTRKDGYVDVQVRPSPFLKNTKIECRKN